MATDETPSVAPARSWGGGFGYAWLLILLLGLYVLSPGPILQIYGAGTPAFLQKAYIPLEYLYRKVPAVQKFYDWEFKLCGVK